jgi:hypothetical protein
LKSTYKDPNNKAIKEANIEAIIKEAHNNTNNNSNISTNSNSNIIPNVSTNSAAFYNTFNRQSDNAPYYSASSTIHDFTTFL